MVLASRSPGGSEWPRGRPEWLKAAAYSTAKSAERHLKVPSRRFGDDSDDGLCTIKHLQIYKPGSSHIRTSKSFDHLIALRLRWYRCPKRTHFQYQSRWSEVQHISNPWVSQYIVLYVEELTFTLISIHIYVWLLYMSLCLHCTRFILEYGYTFTCTNTQNR